MTRPPLTPAFLLLAFIATLVVTCSGCATAAHGPAPKALETTPDLKSWWKSTVRAPGKFEPLVFEQEAFPKSCNWQAQGCYVPEHLASATPARIYIRSRLEPWDYWCTHRHEMWHHKGWDHVAGLSDCG